MSATDLVRTAPLSSRSIANENDNQSSAWTLITEEPWDAYHLESLLALKETHRENAEFGFLLRHYWIPATALTFRQSSRVTDPDGKVQRHEWQIERRMARCRSNECTWREIVTPVMTAAGNGTVTKATASLSESLCSYNCYDQTYVSAKPVSFQLPTENQKEEARRLALRRLPILCPPGPVPIGFTWHARIGDDYMNFRLDAEEHIGETSVLVIRREGRLGAQQPAELSGATHANCGSSAVPTMTFRKGTTLFAWQRGVVLEDRYLDRLTAAGEDSQYIASKTTQVVVRLVRSCPMD